jgi:hypothetical protein
MSYIPLGSPIVPQFVATLKVKLREVMMWVGREEGIDLSQTVHKSCNKQPKHPGVEENYPNQAIHPNVVNTPLTILKERFM